MRPADPRWRAALAALFLVLASLRLAMLLKDYRETWSREAACSEGMDRNVEAGEALIHGVSLDRVSWSMPGFSVADAVVCHPGGRPWGAALPEAALLLSAVLVFGLGWLTGGALRGGAAALFFSLALSPSSAFGDRWLYSLSVLAVAFLLVWRGCRPSWPKSLLLGTAIGMSLLVMSPLALFPAILVLLVLLEPADRTRAGPGRLAHAAALCLVPALLLTPWMLMNHRLHNGLVVLERGRADNNLITGALGLVPTLGQGDARLLAGVPAGQSAAGWAAREALRHPGRSLKACAGRAWYAASLHPLLFFLALLAAGLRRRPGERHLALLAAYLLGVHCLVSVEEKSFTPLWPLAAALAASLLCPGEDKPPSPRAQIWAGALAAAGLVPLAALHLYAAGLVLRYPQRSQEPQALDREAARCPEEAWVWSRRGRERLRRGQAGLAAEDLSRAFAIEAGGAQAVLLAKALLASGQAPRRALALLDSVGEGSAEEKHVLKGLHFLRAGQRVQAAEEFAAAKEAHERLLILHRLETPGDLQVQGRLLSVDQGLERRIFETASYWAPAQRLALILRLDDLLAAQKEPFLSRDRLAPFWLDLAEEAVGAGRRAQAREILRRLESLPPDLATARRMAQIRAGLGGPGPAGAR